MLKQSKALEIMQKPKVSIVCITFNHESYISQAIEGFLMQQTNFPVEIIIADDASTDKTQKLIQGYAKKYPAIIVPILRKKNIGIGENLKQALLSAKGDYIAMCEGDDYWTSPNKLSIQANYLDKNLKHHLCFHSTKVIYEDNSRRTYMIPRNQESFTLRKLIAGNFMHTSSVMYRSSKYDNLPTNMLPIDWYLNLYHAKYGKIGYINQEMSVYRRNRGSVWYPEPNRIDDFWIRHGLGHARMFEEVYGLFIETRYEPAAAAAQNAWTQFLIDLDLKYNAGVMLGLCETVPGALKRYFISQKKEFLQINSELNRVNEQLRQIEHSYLWHLTNKYKRLIDIKTKINKLRKGL